MLQNIVVQFKNDITGPCYGFGNKVAATEIAKQLPPIVKFLGEKNFLVGENVTFIDFYFYEVL
jgi:glutathione S-transferase